MTTCNGCERRRTALKQLFFGTLGAARSARRLASGAAFAALGMPAIGRATTTLRDSAAGNRKSQYGNMPMWAARSAWGGSTTGTLQLTLQTWLAAGTYPVGPRTAWSIASVMVNRAGQALPRKVVFKPTWEQFTYNNTGGCNNVEVWVPLDGYAYQDWNLAFVRTTVQDGYYFACGSNCFKYAGPEIYQVDYDFNA